MNKIHSAIASIIYLSLLSTAQADICEPYPPKETKPVYSYKATYENPAWGYSIEIPKGYTGGLFQDPAAPQHGIQVILSWEPRSYIHFSGEANSLEDKNDKPLDAYGHCLFGLDAVREHSKEIQSFEMRKSKLGPYDGYTYIIHYTCPKNSQKRVLERIVVIHPASGIVYDVTLETTSSRFKNDHKLFMKFVSTWRKIDRK